MVTHREVERVSTSRTARIANWVATLAKPIFRLLWRVPALRSRLVGTLGARSGAVYSSLDKKQFREAFHLALDGLTYCESKSSAFGLHKLHWWMFMESAAHAATELGDEDRQQVLARLSAAPEPGGVIEARCLAIFSRWGWAAHDEDRAIELARRAVLADATWPQGHILLAWYGLLTGRFDPLPRLREAVRASPDSLAEITANADFARFPELIAALQNGSD